MRSEDQARSLTSEPLTNRFDFVSRGFLFCEDVIESEHEQRIRIRKHALVERQSVTRLIDSLIDRHDVTGDLANECLEWHPGAKEELERAGDPLLEQRWIRPFRCLPERPLDPAHFGHRRESVVHLPDVAV